MSGNTSLLQNSFRVQLQSNNYSPNSNSSSSSETSSFDSGKDSGNWSCSTASNSAKMADQLQTQNNNNNNFQFSKGFNYKQLHSLNGNPEILTNCRTNNLSTNTERHLYQQQKQLEADYLGVRHLIRKFSNTNANNETNLNNLAWNSRPNKCSMLNYYNSWSTNGKKIRKKLTPFYNYNNVSEDSEDYDEYSGDENEDEEKYYFLFFGIGIKYFLLFAFIFKI